MASRKRNSSGVISMIINPSKTENEKSTYGDRIRDVADQLKRETQLQIKVTSRILGAAAQISQNHDRLIDQVSEMIQEDLAQEATVDIGEIVTIDQLKKQFKTLSEAKKHFNLKANSWSALIDKINQSIGIYPLNTEQSSVPQRLESIENQLKLLGDDLNQVRNLLTMILDKVS